jgi:glutaminyl-tRNA synthetase
VEEGYVNGWDDPRLPTIEGFFRRGYTAQAINNFCEKIGITRNSNLISMKLLEQCCRMDLDAKAPRVMAVLDPLKVVIENFNEVRQLEAPDFPSVKGSKTHSVPFSGELYIERSDFSMNPPKGYHRLTPNQPVGLKYFSEGNIAVKDVITDKNGEVVELRVTIVPKDKVKAHIHWAAAPAPGKTPLKVEARLYDSLFTVDDLAEVDNFLDHINPDSLKVVTAYVDPYLVEFGGDHVQFERHGFFYKDPDSTPEKPVWNLTVSLKQDKTKQ